MNPREAMVKARYEADGWTMLRPGAPDFLGTRTVDGRFEVRAVEVKRPEDDLAPAQRAYRAALEAAGVSYVVEIVVDAPLRGPLGTIEPIRASPQASVVWCHLSRIAWSGINTEIDYSLRVTPEGVVQEEVSTPFQRLVVFEMQTGAS